MENILNAEYKCMVPRILKFSHVANVAAIQHSLSYIL